MRELLAATISAAIQNIGVIASAEPDMEKRNILVRQLAEDTITGIQDCQTELEGCFYSHETAELKAVVKVLKGAYCNKHDTK